MNSRISQLLSSQDKKENNLADIELTTFKTISAGSIDEENVLPAQPKPLAHKLSYLKDYKESEIIAFEKHFNKNRFELENLIEKHKARYWFDYSRNILAAGTNIPWIYYGILTGSKGVQSFANVIDPSTPVSDGTANVIGSSLAVTGTMSYLFYASPGKDAALSTLAYATSDPLYKQIETAFTAAKNNPKQAAIETAKFLGNYSVIGTTYLATGMSEIVPFIGGLNAMPPGAKWLIMGAIQYFSWRYMDTFMGKSYFNGLAFWENKENREYLINKVRKGEIAIPLQVFFQGIISTVGLRSFPNYYFIAESAVKALGGFTPSWPISGSVALLVAWHSLCVLYPATYNRYVQADEKADALLKNKIDQDSVNEHLVERIKHLNLDTMSEAELTTLKQNIAESILLTQLPELGDKARDKLQPDEIVYRVSQHLRQLKLTGLSTAETTNFTRLISESILLAEKDILKEKIRKEIGVMGLFKEEPWSAITVGWQGAIGAYFGAKFLAPLLVASPPAYLAAITGLTGTAAFAGFAHRAESNRVINNLSLKQLEMTKQKEAELAKIAASEKQTGAEIAATLFAAGFASASAATNTISTIGSNSLIAANPSPLLNTTIASMATQSGLNSIEYNYPNVKETLTGVFNSIADSFKKIHAYGKEKQAEDKLQSWVIVEEDKPADSKADNKEDATSVSSSYVSLFSPRHLDKKSEGGVTLNTKPVSLNPQL
jgi:hypothetical protein